MNRQRIGALLTLALALGAVPATAGADQPVPDVTVCNEAQSSFKGVLDATASTGPLPPAGHKDAAMAVGRGKGLVNAAEHSPALAVCGGDETPT